MAVLGREALQQAVKYTLVAVPEMGGEIRLRSLSSARVVEMMEVLNINDTRKTSENLRMGAHLLVDSWVDDAGQQVLTVEDVPMVLDLPPGVLMRLVNAVFNLNGLGEDAEQEAKKNSEATPDEDSGSA